MRTRVLSATALVLLFVGAPAAQSDLDRLMKEVLSRRDDNWKKLQQYTLREANTFRLLGPMDTPLFGSKREYAWVPREGFFIRSPISADGVTIGDAERRREEQRWLAREQGREKARARRRAEELRAESGGAQPGTQADAADTTTEPPEPEVLRQIEPDVIRQTLEPEFISSAYFLDFKFEGGHYAFVGRERLLDRDVLRIEYYPEKLFGPDERRGRNGSRGGNRGGQSNQRSPTEERIQRGMNKVSLVTLWVDPAARQILQYEFKNVDADFLPARWLLRLDEMSASMRMGNPFPDVWLPASVGIHVSMTLAIGRLSASYDVTYHDYKLAETSGRVVP